MEAYMSMITPYGCNFVIRNWGACAGGLISISQMNALFSLLGTAFGGDGRTSFGLPDLRGRAAIGFGTPLPPLSPHALGQRGGLEGVTLNSAQLPSHHHGVNLAGATAGGDAYLPVSADPGSVTDPDGAYLGVTGGTVRPYAPSLSTPPGAMGPIPIPAQAVQVNGMTQNAGGSAPVYTESPYQAVNYQICMYGLYPSRS